MSTHVIKAVYMLLRNGLSPQKEAGSDVTIISATHVKSQLLVGRLLALEKKSKYRQRANRKTSNGPRPSDWLKNGRTESVQKA